MSLEGTFLMLFLFAAHRLKCLAQLSFQDAERENNHIKALQTWPKASFLSSKPLSKIPCLFLILPLPYPLLKATSNSPFLPVFLSPRLSLLAPETLWLSVVFPPPIWDSWPVPKWQRSLCWLHTSLEHSICWFQLNSCRSLLQRNFTHPGIAVPCRDRKLEYVISSGARFAFATSLVLGSYHLFYWLTV